jgi:hypothetical protein
LIARSGGVEEFFGTALCERTPLSRTNAGVMMRSLLLAIALIWFVTAPVRATSPDADAAIERATHEFDDVISELDASGLDSGSIGYASAVANAYQQFSSSSMKTGKLSTLSDESLSSIFRVLNTVVFYTSDARYLPEMQSVAEQILLRGALSPAQVDRLYGAYVRSRMFAEAEQFLRTHRPQAQSPFPAISKDASFNAALPAIIKLQEEGLLIANIRMDSSLQIVVTTGPYCAPSQRALRDISSDSSLSAFFRRHALWLLPVDSDLHVDHLKRYSELAAVGSVGVAYDRTGWSLVDSWSTPTFYFLRDGRVVTKVQGWPKGGRLEEVRRAIQNVSTLPPPERAKP